jgi:hypothetical protein
VYKYREYAGPRPTWPLNATRYPGRLKRGGRIGYENDRERQQAERQHQPKLQHFQNRDP